MFIHVYLHWYNVYLKQLLRFEHRPLYSKLDLSAGHQSPHTWEFVTIGLKIKPSRAKVGHTIDLTLYVYLVNTNKGENLVKTDKRKNTWLVAQLHNKAYHL